MGMYTELRFACQLKPNTSESIIKLLSLMVQGEGNEYNEPLPDHPFFKTDRWAWMLNCDSYYFNADTHSTLRYDDIANRHYLTIQCNLKNYSGEIEGFLSWINPYIDACDGEHMGHTRYEETDEPTILHYKKAE